MFLFYFSLESKPILERSTEEIDLPSNARNFYWQLRRIDECGYGKTTIKVNKLSCNKERRREKGPISLYTSCTMCQQVMLRTYGYEGKRKKDIPKSSPRHQLTPEPDVSRWTLVGEIQVTRSIQGMWADYILAHHDRPSVHSILVFLICEIGSNRSGFVGFHSILHLGSPISFGSSALASFTQLPDER